VAAPGLVSPALNALPRLLYIGDVSVTDTVAGAALLYRLLQFYPADQLAVVAPLRPGAPTLPGVAYHEWPAMFPRLFHSRFAPPYQLWRARRYYEVPPAIARVATLFRPEAILSVSHLAAWLGAWQLAQQRRLPFHLIAHDDQVYSHHFPKWSRGWAERKFGQAYRDAVGRFCISDTMADLYQQRFGAAAQVIYPTYKADRVAPQIGPRVGRDATSLVFGYGGSINSASDMDQLIAFGRAVTARGHRLVVFSPQHHQIAARASLAAVSLDTRAPIHSEELSAYFRAEADCLVLPQSLAAADATLVATAFPSKWSDYSMAGLPVIVWAPPGSSSERFVREHPGCAELVTTTDPADLERAISTIERSPEHRRRLAETLVTVGRDAFSPHDAWAKFSATLCGAGTSATPGPTPA
jgi:glycosyltransferase involved in cell wall biosynthesis